MFNISSMPDWLESAIVTADPETVSRLAWMSFTNGLATATTTRPSSTLTGMALNRWAVSGSSRDTASGWRTSVLRVHVRDTDSFGNRCQQIARRNVAVLQQNSNQRWCWPEFLRCTEASRVSRLRSRLSTRDSPICLETRAFMQPLS